MSPEEICRALGEDKVKAMFLELTTDGMKKILRESRLPTTRLASHTSVKRRNEDWAARLFRAASEPQKGTAAAIALLFEWLTRTRRPMLAEFLDGLGVKHEAGLTDAEFMTSPPEQLCAVAEKLLEHHDRREVAAYLLFLDATNKTDHFSPLGLAKWIAVAPATQPATVS